MYTYEVSLSERGANDWSLYVVTAPNANNAIYKAIRQATFEGKIQDVLNVESRWSQKAL